MFNFIGNLFGRKPRIEMPRYEPQYEYTSNTTTIVLKPEAKPAVAKKARITKNKAK